MPLIAHGEEVSFLAGEARDAVNAALRNFGALSVGEVGSVCPDLGDDCGLTFIVGYESFVLHFPEILFLSAFDVDFVNTQRGFTEAADDWITGGINTWTYNFDERNWAVFTEVPEPGATLSLATALATLGVIARSRRKKSEGTAQTTHRPRRNHAGE